MTTPEISMFIIPIAIFTWLAIVFVILDFFAGEEGDEVIRTRVDKIWYFLEGNSYSDITYILLTRFNKRVRYIVKNKPYINWLSFILLSFLINLASLKLFSIYVGNEEDLFGNPIKSYLFDPSFHLLLSGEGEYGYQRLIAYFLSIPILCILGDFISVKITWRLLNKVKNTKSSWKLISLLLQDIFTIVIIIIGVTLIISLFDFHFYTLDGGGAFNIEASSNVFWSAIHLLAFSSAIPTFTYLTILIIAMVILPFLTDAKSRS